MTNNTTLRLGQPVTYTDSRGYQKAAFVVGTSDSVQPGHDLPVPDEGHAHLAIFSPTGAVYARHNIPEAVDAFSTQAYTV
jgi:hypothetical protein